MSDRMTDMSGLYSNFKVNPSRKSGTLTLDKKYGLRVDEDEKAEDWMIFDAESGDFVTQNEVSQHTTLIKSFQEDWNKMSVDHVKDPIENLKDNGFEFTDVPEETSEKVKESSNWSDGGFKKLKHEPPVIKDVINEYEDDDFEECSPTPEEERVLNSVVPVRSGSIVQRRPSRTIKGLTPILAECGKIKIGKKGKIIKSRKGTDFRPPERMDHFEITTMDKNDNDDFVLDEYIMNKIGRDAREINVRLPYDDPSLNFYTSYAKYEGSACKCRGDGELAINNHKIIQCNPEQCEYYIKNKCKPNGILSLILDDAPRVGGVYKFRTVGWNSINNVYSSMEFIRGLTNGLLAGLPLVLTLTPKHVTIPDTSKRTVIYMVNLEYRGSLQDMVTAIQQTINTRSMMQYSIRDFEKLAEEMISLPEAPDECKDIVAEFYPDEVEA